MEFFPENHVGLLDDFGLMAVTLELLGEVIAGIGEGLVGESGHEDALGEGHDVPVDGGLENEKVWTSSGKSE